MSAALAIVVPGTPVGAARPRVVRNQGRVRAFMPDDHTAWESRATLLARAGWRGLSPLDEPVRVELVAWHSRPQRLRRRADPREAMAACCKPDLDNVLKLAMDALVKAGVLVDDTRVVTLTASRFYLPIGADGEDTEPERVAVSVWRTTDGGGR